MLRDRQGGRPGRQLAEPAMELPADLGGDVGPDQQPLELLGQALLQVRPPDQLLHPRAGFLPQVETVAVQLTHQRAATSPRARSSSTPAGSAAKLASAADSRNKRQTLRRCTATFAEKWEEMTNPTES